MKKIPTSNSTMRTIILPIIAVGALSGFAEAASGVRIHRIGDPPLLPREVEAQMQRERHAVRPVEQTLPVPAAPDMYKPAVPIAPEQPVYVKPASASRVAPPPPPAPRPVAAPKHPAPVPPPAAAPQQRRARLPLAPVGFRPNAAPAPTPAPVAAPHHAPKPVPAPVAAPAPKRPAPVAKPAPAPVRVVAPAPPAPAPAPKTAPRRRLPLAPVELPPVPANLVR